ncbi:MAG: UPF0489 family protein [Clostridia bacterium]|nr:UPF0489 family protein [Clostridia bacterium]
MHVLDIDLDFFLEDVCPLAPLGERPGLEGHRPWSPEATERFLTEQCGLDAANPIPGVVFETHDMALRLWQSEIAKGRLTVPFAVTHIDAHSDLGIGKPGPGYVLNTVIAQSPELRRDSERHYGMHQLDEANYLLFALAYRYVDRLENIRNPRSKRDISQQILVPGTTDRIRLESFVSRLMVGKNGPEPEIPFDVYDDWTEYRAPAPFDLMSVAISPRYAPKEADELLSVFRKFMRPIGQ